MIITADLFLVVVSLGPKLDGRKSLTSLVSIVKHDFLAEFDMLKYCLFIQRSLFGA